MLTTIYSQTHKYDFSKASCWYLSYSLYCANAIHISQLSTHEVIITTLDLHIIAGIITAGFVRTGSDVPSLPVMSLKIKKMIGAGLKPAVKDHITAGLWLEPVVFWRALITVGLSQEPTVIGLYHCRF